MSASGLDKLKKRVLWAAGALVPAAGLAGPIHSSLEKALDEAAKSGKPIVLVCTDKEFKLERGEIDKMLKGFNDSGDFVCVSIQLDDHPALSIRYQARKLYYRYNAYPILLDAEGGLVGRITEAKEAYTMTPKAEQQAKAFRESARRFKEDPAADGWKDFVEDCKKRGKIKEASAVLTGLEKAKKIQRQEADCLRAGLWMYSEDFKKAEQILLALSKDPEWSAAARLELALSREMRGDTDGAISVLQEMLSDTSVKEENRFHAEERIQRIRDNRNPGVKQ